MKRKDTNFRHRSTLLIVFIILTTIALQAQYIRGKVIDSKNRPIHKASIALLTEDSTFVEATISKTDGSFTLNFNKNPFVLIIQHIDYNSHRQKYDTDNVGIITLATNHIQLGEVTISATKTYAKTENGKLIYNTKTLTKNRIVNNAWDLLNKLPGVSTQDNSISLSGAPEVIILVDGVLSMQSEEQLYSTLNNMPASRIVQAEIIYNAPPEYHTNGAVINLKTKWLYRKFNEVKALKKYIEGEIGVNYTNQFYSAGGFDRSFRFASPKLNFDFSFAAGKIKNMEYAKVTSTHTLNKNIYTITQTEQLSRKYWENDIRSSLNYKFNDKNSIDIVYSGVFTPNTKSINLVEGGRQKSINSRIPEYRVHNISLRTNLSVGLSLGVAYTHYRLDDDQTLLIDYKNGGFGKHTVSGKQKIEGYTVYADQKHTIKNGWNIGYGASYSYTTDKDSQIYNLVIGMDSTPDTNAKIEEHKADLYLSTSKRFSTGLSFNASVKGEYYKIKSDKTWTIYPQLSLSYSKNPQHRYQFGVSSNKVYPAYWTMLPSVRRIDGYSEIQGSPGIQPSSNYNLNANYIFKQKYIFGAFYTYSKDYIAQAPYQSTDRLALIYKTMNWDFMQTAGVNITLPLNRGNWLESKLTVNGFYMHQKCDDFFDMSFNRQKFGFSSNIENSFIINKHLLFELNARLLSPTIYGTLNNSTTSSVDVGMRLKLINDKLDISAHCNDIFNTSAPKQTVDYNGQNLIMDNRFYTRSVNVSLIFRFGGFKPKSMKRVDTSRFGH